MEIGKEEYTKVHEEMRCKIEERFFLEWKVELWFHLVCLTVAILITQFFYPSLTVPIVIAWLGISVNAKLTAIHYFIKIHICYLQEFRDLGWNMLNKNKTDNE